MLQVQDLHCSLGSTTILHGVSLSVQAGERVGIIGPNGSGKTTLFNCLSGFLRVQSGSIILNGEDITHFKPDAKARVGLGRVFQNFGIFRELTVEENLVLAVEASRDSATSKSQVRERVRESLAFVKLSEKAREKAGSLSGGQMRLLEIARIMAFGASVFLLDEPTAGVSPRMKDEVEAMLVHLRDAGKTLLIIEHDLPFIERLCQRIIVLDSGRVVLDDVPENVRQSTVLQDIYFGKSHRGAA